MLSPPRLRITELNVLSRLVDELRRVEDPLSVASCLEVTTGLLETPWGISWLEEKGVLGEIDGQLANIAASDFASLLLPRFIEFMGKGGGVLEVTSVPRMSRCIPLPSSPTAGIAGRKHPSSTFFDSYPGFKRQLCAMMAQGAEDGDALLALQTVAHLCRSPAPKAALLGDNNPEFLGRSFARLHDFVLRNRGDLRADGLSILADLVTVQGGGDGDEEGANKELFRRFGGDGGEDGVSLLMKFAQMPFENVSVMSYEVLLRLAGQKWALEKINLPVRSWVILLYFGKKKYIVSIFFFRLV